MAWVVYQGDGWFHSGSNPARTRIICVAHRVRAEIFALPSPLLELLQLLELLELLPFDNRSHHEQLVIP